MEEMALSSGHRLKPTPALPFYELSGKEVRSRRMGDNSDMRV